MYVTAISEYAAVLFPEERDNDREWIARCSPLLHVLYVCAICKVSRSAVPRVLDTGQRNANLDLDHICLDHTKLRIEAEISQ